MPRLRRAVCAASVVQKWPSVQPRGRPSSMMPFGHSRLHPTASDAPVAPCRTYASSTLSPDVAFCSAQDL
eukprot:7232832-Prymnesium_polylepis.1